VRYSIAEESDAPVVATLVNRLIEELGGSPLPSDEAHAAAAHLVGDTSAGFAVIAWDDTQPIGVCTVSFQHAIRTLGTYATIQEMYVVPAWRSRQAGSQLVEIALAEAARHGCAMVELGTPPHGDRQITFYERLGFRAVGQRLRKTLQADDA